MPRFSGAAPLLSSPDFPDLFDDLPLWSAPFGLALLDRVRLAPGLVVLDVGCGTGFPLVELAHRLGRTARVHGVDPWEGALARVRRKLDFFGLDQVTLHEACCEALPLPDASVDLIVSNNGLNNVTDLPASLAECARVARPGAQLLYAYNLPSSMMELYEPLEALLAARGLSNARTALAAHIDHKRKPVEVTTAALTAAGFVVTAVEQHSFALRFVNATAMFDCAFIRYAFLPAWVEVLPEDQREPVFAELERRLNTNGPMSLTVPFVVVEARR